MFSKSRWVLAAAALALVPAVRPAAAQTAATRIAARASSTPDIVGTYQAKAKPAKLEGKASISTIVIRADSSASYGKEIVRWRLPKPGTVLLALGGEWVAYDIKLKGDQLTLSGGDLTQPVTLKRVGPATPRPAGVKVPGDPDTEE